MKRKLDVTLLITILITSIYGIIMIYSASSVWAEYKFNDEYYYLKRQLIYGLLAIISYFIMFIINLYFPKAYEIIIVPLYNVVHQYFSDNVIILSVANNSILKSFLLLSLILFWKLI